MKNNSSFGNSKCVAENGPAPPDERMAKITQISKLNKRDAMVNS